MEGWMSSTGHKENILNPEFTHLGVGYEDAPDDITGTPENPDFDVYWTQVFGTDVFSS